MAKVKAVLLKPIENKSIVWKHLNTIEPLNFTNGVLSINKDNLDAWNGYGDEISAVNEKLDNNNTEINNKVDTIKTDLGDLGDQVATIQGQQNINTNDISNLKTKDTQQDTKIEQNTTAITKLIQQLQDSNLINYVGQYQAGQTYKLGQVVSYAGKMFLCKAETTTNSPDNTDDWDLLSAPEINLDNYVTNEKLTDELDKYTPLETFNNFEMDADGRLAVLETDLKALQQTVQAQAQQIQSLQTQLEQSIKSVSLSNNTITFTRNDNQTISLNLANLQKWDSYFNKTQLTDNSTILKLREIYVGRYDTARIRMYSYDSQQFIVDWNADINWMIGTGDKRFGQSSRNANWRSRE